MKLSYRRKIYYFFLGVVTMLIINLLFTNCCRLTLLWQNINPIYNETNYTVLNIINCKDKPLTKVIRRGGNFWIFYNFVKAEREFNCDESVTYTTPATYLFLDNLPSLVRVWKGPISVALYAPGTDFHTTLITIAYMRNCETPLIRQLVTFHIFFDENRFPTKYDDPLTEAYEDTYNCTNSKPFKNRYDTYIARHKLIFPINIARNIARETVQTYFVFPSDIELYPTPNFIEKFLKMVVNRKTLFTDPIPKIFVLPIFEIFDIEIIPTNKTQLQKMYKHEFAVILQENFCKDCHKVIKGNKWLNTVETEGLDIFAVGKRYNQYKSWEPFYVGSNDDPLFDGRFTWEGRYDKTSQLYALCLLNYNFVILDNAFLIHNPIAERKEEATNYKELIEKSKLLLSEIKEGLIILYGSNSQCFIT